jgi:FAD/FMN-containing dehydrogenase
VEENFDGVLYRRDEVGYEQARQDAVWNKRKPNRFPDAILVAHTVEDVVRGIRLATLKDWKVGVRSGGHSWIGNAIRDGGLTLDLSALSDLEIDAATGTAAIGPAIRGKELNDLLEPFNFYFPTGHCPSVGLGGFTLGGGYGWNSRVIGPACMSILGIDVVTADVELVHADAEHHSDLYWSARGGGPDFAGVITRFYMQLHRRPAGMCRSLYVFDGGVYDELIPWFVAKLDEMHPALQPVLVAHHNPMPGATGTAIVISATAFGETEPESRAMLDTLRDCPVIERAVMRQEDVPTSLNEGYAFLATLYPEGWRYLADAVWVEPERAGFVDAAKELIETLPSAKSHVVWAPWVCTHFGDGAHSLSTNLSCHGYAVYDDPGDDDAMEAWLFGTMRKSYAPYSIGGKVNDSNLMARGQSVISASSEERMTQIRERYDPHRRFNPLQRPEMA